jgi:hypothetical protein
VRARSFGPKDRPWELLADALAPEVPRAPRTAGDPAGAGQWPAVHGRAAGYLARNARGAPWLNHLALAAAVLSARRLDVHTVTQRLMVLHRGFSDLFPALGLTGMDAWDADAHLPAYLRGDVLPGHRQRTRSQFWTDYSAVAHHLRLWARSLPPAEQARYRRFVLPLAHPWSVEGLTKKQELTRQTQAARKAETEALFPHFMALRAQAHRRFNRLARLRAACRRAVAEVERRGRAALPVAFDYPEGGDPRAGVPPQERLRFRVWDRRSFVLHHRDRYSAQTVRHARAGRYGFAAARNGLFLEFIGADRLAGDGPPDGLWFADLLRRGMLGTGPLEGRPEEIAAKQAWLRAWGYGEEGSTRRVAPFATQVGGLLTWGGDHGPGSGQFIGTAQARTDGVLIPLESLHAAAAFGLLAVEIFTTTGMRVNEAMQIRMARECYFAMDVDPPPGAADRSPSRKWFFRLIPKGERTNRPRDYHVDEETRRVIAKVVWLLCKEHYRLAGDQGLPSVPFAPLNGRAHRFAPAPYLFQFNRRALDDQGITACMRFLLHGMVFRTRDGQPVLLKSHLLRHVIATHLLNVEEIPIDIVAEILKQKNLAVTAYYAKAPPSVVADRMDAFLAGFATYINLGEAILRTPAEVQRQLAEARGKAGTLAEVEGGTCVQPDYCPGKSMCIGCPCNAPNPAKRRDPERKKRWAEQERDRALREGRLLDARRYEQTVKDCGTMLQEMDAMEAWRRDEERDVDVRLPVVG